MRPSTRPTIMPTMNRPGTNQPTAAVARRTAKRLTVFTIVSS
jgi:hypothetical protein